MCCSGPPVDCDRVSRFCLIATGRRRGKGLVGLHMVTSFERRAVSRRRLQSLLLCGIVGESSREGEGKSRLMPPSGETAFEALSRAERETLLARLDSPTGGQPRLLASAHEVTVLEEPLTDSVDRYSRSAPAGAAVRFDGETLSYADLVAQSRRVSAALTSAGVVRGDRVALIVRRRAEAVSCMLGILRCGAACVPIDLRDPPTRVAAILSDAAPSFIFSDVVLNDRGVPVASPEEALSGGIAVAAADPDMEPRSSDAAFVMYTSGTTGVPKGVVLEHRSILNYCRVATDLFGLSASDRILGFAAFTYDVALFDVFGSLINGATCCLASEEERLDPELLIGLLREEHVSVAELPVTYMNLLNPDGLPHLRIVSTGGEPVAASTLAKWRTPTRRVFTGYGPTETTVMVTALEFDQHEGTEGVTDIGYVMPNHRIAVVDDDGSLVPPGTPGELVIAGPGVARGYLGRSDLSEERFTSARPLFGDDDGRAYRTGDIVVYDETGRIRFLHRMDRQVKIRGQRVELGEVEAAVESLPDVRQAACEVRSDATGGSIVEAYILPAENSQLDPTRLREEVSGILPPYMIPGKVTLLDELPLTSSGKVDRSRLRATGATSPRESNGAGAGLEAAIAAQILQPLLGDVSVDADTHFLHLGGNSLIAMHAVTAIKSRFGVHISLAEFFSHPTLKTLAGLVSSRLADPAEAPLSALSTLIPLTGGDAKVIFLHPIGGGVACYQALVNCLSPDVAVAGLASLPPPGMAARSIGNLAREHLDTLQELPECPNALVGWSFGGVLAFEMARQLESAEGHAPHVVMIDAILPLMIGAQWTDDEVVARFITDVTRTVGLTGDEPATLQGLVEVLVESGNPVSRSELSHRLETFKHNLRLLERFHPAPCKARVVDIVGGATALKGDSWPSKLAPHRQRLIIEGVDHYSIIAGASACRIAALIRELTCPS